MKKIEKIAFKGNEYILLSEKTWDEYTGGTYATAYNPKTEKGGIYDACIIYWNANNEIYQVDVYAGYSPECGIM